MNIDNVELRPANTSNSVVMSFRDPSRRNAYHVKDITGLDSDAITPKYYGGFNFYNLSMDKREVVMRIQLNPYRDTTTPVGGSLQTPIDTSPTSYTDLRDKLYKLIASSRTGLLELRFKLGNTVVAAISGFVSKFEANLFVKEPEVQLTVVCPDSLLKALTMTALSSVELTALQAMGTPTITDNISTAPHSVMLEFKASGTPASFKIINPSDSPWSFEVTPVGGFQNNDILFVSSDPLNKQLYLNRGASTIHLGDVLTPGSVWPILFPGTNQFNILTSGFTWNLVEYFATYWGV